MNGIKLGVKFDQKKEIWRFGWVVRKKFLALGKTRLKEEAIKILIRINKEMSNEYRLIEIK